MEPFNDFRTEVLPDIERGWAGPGRTDSGGGTTKPLENRYANVPTHFKYLHH